jgi:hypothetical protein
MVIPKDQRVKVICIHSYKIALFETIKIQGCAKTPTADCFGSRVLEPFSVNQYAVAKSIHC